MTAQLLPDCTPTQYHADPCPTPSLSSTIAKLLAFATPAHAQLAHPRLTPPKVTDDGESEPKSETPSQSRGTIMHALVLGKGAELVEVKADNWRTKAAQEARDNAQREGKQAVLSRALADYRKGADAIRARLENLGIVLTGTSEAVVTWTDHASDGTPILCRMMVDHLLPPLALDLKTLESAAPDSCQRQADQYGHALQRAHYTRGLQALYPDAPTEFVFAFAETDAPHAVTLADSDGTHRELGEMQWMRAADKWAACMKSGHWPAVYGTNGRASLTARPWQLQTEMGYLI